MAATARRRTRDGGFPPGGDIIDVNGTTFPCYFTAASMTEVCNDVIGDFGNDHVLTLTKSWKVVKPMSGASFSSTGKLLRYTSGSPLPQGFSPSFGPIVMPPFTTQSMNVLTTKLLGRSNPSRPIVDLPVFAFELKDLPKMIKQAGDAIRWLRSGKRGATPTATGLANANLAYQFGWAPLLSDLWKLLTFQEAYEKKKAELEKLYSSAGLRRSVTLDEQTIGVGGTTYFLHTNGLTLIGNGSGEAKYKAWGSVRWKPTKVPPGTRHPSDLDVFRAALGLDITLATVWEAIPWSWLIDWFTNVGDFLSANRNTIPATHSRICIMEMKTLSCTYSTKTITDGFSWGGASTGSTSKSRTPRTGIIYPSVSLPFLSGSQLSILGSLLIARGSK